MPPETSEEFQEMKEKINAIHQAMFGYSDSPGFLERFEVYCTRVRKLEFLTVGLICILVGMGVLTTSAMGLL